jgi:competence ComEA-like helix-hairpin-helix protein
VFTRICSACHETGTATALRKSKADWAKTVDDMLVQGANGTDEEMAQIVDYLTENFGAKLPERGKINVNKASAAEVAAALDLPPKQGEMIVQFRVKNGNFKDLADLKKVPYLDAAKIDGQKNRIEF